MPDTTTTNYAFVKPDPGGSDNTWAGKLNANFDAIDAQLKTLADRPVEDAASILTKLKTVDGSGSGLDADKLDGLDASDYASAGHTHTAYALKAAGFAATRLFITDTFVDPTSQPGDIWLCLTAPFIAGAQGNLQIRNAANVLKRIV